MIIITSYRKDLERVQDQQLQCAQKIELEKSRSERLDIDIEVSRNNLFLSRPRY